MQIIKNISWNFTAGIWIAALTILVTPFYVSKLGLYNYSLISIWLVFQAIMNLFDFGLGATLTKEFSSVNSNKKEDSSYPDTLKTIEILYWTISALCVFSFVFVTHFFLNDWIALKFIKIENISSIIILMFLSIFFQFPNTLYINGLIGLQKHKLASILQIIGNALKFGIGSIIIYKENNLFYFFYAQIIIAIFQTVISRYFLWNLVSINGFRKPIFKFSVLKKIAGFSKQMALTSILAVFISNIDKLLVFKMLQTDDLSRYSIAFTATGFMQLAIQPFYRSFFPRYSQLFSKEEFDSLEKEYFISNKLISFLIISLSVICFVFADDIFFIWMGKIDLIIINIFRFLICGMMFSGLGWLPAAFQQAIGWPGLHVKMMLLALVIAIPIMFISINQVGILGASFIWFIHGIIDITIGLWIMHKTILRGQLKKWYVEVLIPPFFYSIPVALVSHLLKPEGLSRVSTFFWLSSTSLMIFILVAFNTKKVISKK